MYFDNKLMKEPRASPFVEENKKDLMQELWYVLWKNYSSPVYAYMRRFADKVHLHHRLRRTVLKGVVNMLGGDMQGVVYLVGDHSSNQSCIEPTGFTTFKFNERTLDLGSKAILKRGSLPGQKYPNYLRPYNTSACCPPARCFRIKASE